MPTSRYSMGISWNYRSSGISHIDIVARPHLFASQGILGPIQVLLVHRWSTHTAMTLPRSDIIALHGDALAFGQNSKVKPHSMILKNHRVCLKARVLPRDASNAMMSLPGDIITSMTSHTTSAIWGWFPPTSQLAGGRETPHKSKGSPIPGGDDDWLVYPVILLPCLVSP